MSRVLVVYAHPYPDRSHANRSLLRAVEGLDGVVIHSLYDRYPDFCIDPEAEQAALSACETVVWHHPLYWYSTPALFTLWLEKVLARGWAYGGSRALAGKSCLWVTTTGGDPGSYAPDGAHGHPFAEFVPPVRQTARFCGMTWLDPLIVHHAHHLTPEALDAAGARYRARVEALLGPAG